MDETREALRRWGLLGAAWPKDGSCAPRSGASSSTAPCPKNSGSSMRLLDRKGVDTVVGRCYKHLGAPSPPTLVDNIKDLGFRYATRSGITIAVSDIRVPEQQAEILERQQSRSTKAERSTAAV
jgi:DNA-directed RNA polymerase beta' subunit